MQHFRNKPVALVLAATMMLFGALWPNEALAQDYLFTVYLHDGNNPVISMMDRKSTSGLVLQKSHMIGSR